MGFYRRCRARTEVHVNTPVGRCIQEAEGAHFPHVQAEALAQRREANKREDPEQMQNLFQQFVGTKHLL